MFCVKCGAEIMEEAFVCPKCGCLTNSKKEDNLEQKEIKVPAIKIVAKVFMIISCIVMGFWIISLAWTIPMTLSYSRKIENNEHVSIGFKICTLLFVNPIAGILMLCVKG